MEKTDCRELLELHRNVIDVESIAFLMILLAPEVSFVTLHMRWHKGCFSKSIHKKGITSDHNNYRPISVIPVVLKVFEKIVYNQLYHYLDGNKFLLGFQSGFRSLHSMLMALLEATDAWSVNIDNGLLINGVVFIDLTKDLFTWRWGTPGR